jgi:hypothetical protein
MLDVKKLLIDVFDPQPGEVVTFAVDLPRDDVPDHDGWSARRSMAERWRGAMVELASERDFNVRPILSFEASGANNADLPAKGRLGDEDVDLLEALKASTLVIAMTEFSATAPLAKLAEDEDDFRAASMPGVEERMEGTALAADYSKVAARCKAIYDIMDGAVLCDVLFSTGHRCWFDLRHRMPEMDDGFLPRGKEGDRIINLPSGETFVVPYEGEFEAVPSWTSGTIPVVENDELILFHVVANTVIVVEGEGPGRREGRLPLGLRSLRSPRRSGWGGRFREPGVGGSPGHRLRRGQPGAGRTCCHRPQGWAAGCRDRRW